MNKKKLLVLGATGFIGRNAAEHYAASGEYQVFCVYNRREPFQHPGVEWIKADLTQAKDVDRALEGMDVVVQAAATTSGAKDIVTKPFIHTTDNAVMNSLIFRSAFEKGVKHLIFFSCTVMYQSGEKAVCETDFDANAPIHHAYFGVGWTKVYLEKMCEFYAKLGKTKFTVLRHSNIYGPHDKFDLERSHVFGATVTKVMTAEGGKVSVWGKGSAERDLLYVSDLMDSMDMALARQTAQYDLFNIGYCQAVSVNDLVQKIINGSGRDLVIEHDLTKPAIYTKLCLDCTKAKETLGWAPKVTLDEGIQKTLSWYRENIKS